MTFSADSYALTSLPVDIAGDHATADRLPFDLGSIRIAATAADPTHEIFVGIANVDDVNRYFANVHRTLVTSVSLSPSRVHYRDIPGTFTPALPGDQDFWVASAEGAGTQQIVTELRSGNWTLVVMNADATPNVSVDMRVGFHSDLFGFIAIALLVGGLVVFLLGVALVVAGRSRRVRTVSGPNRCPEGRSIPPG